MIHKNNTRNIILLITMIALIIPLFSLSVSAEWKDANWPFRKMITINHLNVAGNLNDFPVLVDITSPDFIGKAQADADDFLFTSDDETTQLSHEIESYDPATGHLVAWVKIPSLSSTLDTIIYVYYGNPSATSQEDPENVWDSSFLAVHHLEETDTSIIDSTSNNNDGTAMNGIGLDYPGKIDGAANLDGSDDRIVLPQVMSSQGTFTFEAWANTNNKHGYIVSQRDSSSHGAFLQYYPTTFQIYSDSVHIAVPTTTNAWHYVVGTFDGGTLRLYVDSVNLASSTASITWPALQTFIGDRSALGRAFQGSLDEIRISNTARSQSYITTSYNNQNNPSAFVSAGAEESGGIPMPTITSPVPADNADDVLITTDALSFTITDPQADLLDYTVTAEPNVISGTSTGTDVLSGTYTVPVSGLAYDTLYTWTVSITDGTDIVDSVFTFTTEPEPVIEPLTISSPIPEDEAENVEITTSTLSFTIIDSQGDLIDYTVTTTPDIGSATADDVSSGTYLLPISSLAYDTLYTWTVSATDGVETDEKTFTFTTEPELIIEPGWAFRRQITLDRTKVSGTLTDFPVLIDITIDPGHAQGNAYDVYFTLEDGMTRLSHEIDSYDSATGHLLAWVKIPSLSSITDTVLYMYYGNSEAADQQDAEAVWDSSFLAVQHLEEKSGTVISDSTIHDNDAIPMNGLTLDAIGKINGADSFDGNDDRSIMPQVFTSQGQYTMEAWVNTANKHGYIASQRDGSGHGAFLQYYPSTFQIYSDGTHIAVPTTTNAWHYVVGTFDGGTLRLYVDAGTPVTSTASITWPALQTFIGDRSALGRAFQGSLDEIRLSSVARSENYIRTSYNIQNNPVGFRTVGSEEILELTTAPQIMNENPANGENDVPIASLTSLSFDLFDAQGDPMDYTVTTTPDIGSASVNNVGDGTYTVPVSGVVPGTLYTWTVSATDGVEITERDFTFTAISPPLEASFSNAFPVNRNTTYNPRLSITIVEPEGKDLIITFETNATGTWQPIATQHGKAGTYYQQTYDMMTRGRRYYWRATVSDGYSSKTSDAYSFLVQGAFIEKWRYNNNAKTNNGPLAADVNGDGIYEVFASGQGKVSCMNGLTGQLIWTYTNFRFSEHSPIEIVDLDYDGTLELIIPASDHTIALNAESGTVFWDVAVASANKYPVIVDTDANHYPYVYVADSDHYYGTAMLSKLRGTDGAIVAQTQIWYPCFSGLSAGDADNDGKLEIYMCDRKTGYEGPEGIGRGMQAYDAEDLSLLWYDGGITCSSNLVALIDVNDDGVLDSISLQQSGGSGGIYIIDGSTGEKMPDKWSDNIGLSTHSPPSIYDIDLDGSLELVDGRNSPAKIWDIGSWSLDTTLEGYTFSEPPRFADVVGDDKLEIVGVAEYPGALRIYDWQYDLIESVTNINPIAATIVQDIDNDGQNELIIISNAGIVIAYETSAYTPNLEPRVNSQLYSEKRVGVGIYEPLPGAPQPIIKEVYPVDTAINVESNPTLRARVVDYHYDKLSVEISVKNELDEWEVVETFTNADNGWFEYTPTNMDGSDTTYYWRVTAVDPEGDNMITIQDFSFTTKPKVSMMPGWDFKKKITIDHNKVAGNLNNFPVLIEFTDAEVAANAKADGSDILFTSASGAKLAYEIETYDSATGHLIAWVNVPSLSSSADTIMYMYFGNAAAEDQQDPEGVWDSNYLAVHHLEETATNDITDSTIAGNDGTAFSITDTSLGKIDGADEFDGSNSRITLPTLFTSQNQFTVEGWYYLSGDKNNAYVASQRDLSRQGMLIQYYNGQLQMYVNDRLVSRPTYTYSWHYVVGTFDGSTARLYVDDNIPVTTSSSLTWPEVPTIIGNRPNNDRSFLGRLDELRFSRVARSEAYIRTSYANQNDPLNFITISPAEIEADATKPAVLNELPAHLSDDVPVETTELSFDLFDAQENLMDYTVTSFPDINVGPVVVTGASNGHVVVPISGLLPETEYSWTVEVTDGTETNTKVFIFKTGKAYTITMSASGEGTVSMNIPEAALYSAGTQVEFTATPTEGWEFIGWSGGRLGNVYGMQNPVVVTLGDDVAIYKEVYVGLENHPAMDVAMTAFFKPIGAPLIVDSDFEASIDTDDLWLDSELVQDWYESRNNSWTYREYDEEGNITNETTYYAYDYGMLTLDTSNVGDRTGNKAKLVEGPLFEDRYRLSAYLAQEFSGVQPNRFSVEYDIYVDSILANPSNPDSDMTGIQMLGRDSGRGPFSRGSDRFIVLAFYHDGGSTVPGDTVSLIAPEIESSLSNSSTWDTLASGLQMDRWYRIRLDVDVPARNFDVYVDGTLRASNVPAYGTLHSQVSHIGFASESNTPGTFYVDNVREYVP